MAPERVASQQLKFAFWVNQVKARRASLYSSTAPDIGAGIDLATVMEIAGHKQIKTTFIYTHTTAASKYKAVKMLDVHLESMTDVNQTHTDQSKPEPKRLLNRA